MLSFQTETCFITKKDGPKVYRLFKLLCLKDRVFNSLISRAKSVVPVSTEKAANNTKSSAMVVECGLKLSDQTD